MHTVTDTFVHEGLFYAGADDYLAGTVPFVQAGLAAGDPVLVAVPGPNLARIRSALDGQGRAVRFVDMSVAGRNPGRIIPWVLHAFIAEHPGIRPRTIGEPIWAGRTAQEYAAAAQREALINAAFTGRAATILCPYDTTRLDPQALIEAEGTHPVLVEDGHRRASEAYAPDAIVARHTGPLPAPGGPVVSWRFDEPAALPGLRQLAADQARLAGLSASRGVDLQLAVTELAANSLTHTGAGGVVRFWCTAEDLVCEVEDGGRLTNPLAGRLPPAEDSTGGRGLLIVNHLCDLVRVHSGPDSCTVRLYLRR